MRDLVAALEGLDELSVAADWDNSDDIAHAVKQACIAALRTALSTHEAGQAGGGEAAVWAVLFEDPDCRHQLFTGCGAEDAARRFYEASRLTWACHLVCTPHPTPRADADDASRGCTVAFCERHRAVEVVAGPFCPACSLGDTLRDGIKAGRETEAAFPTRQHEGCDHPRADAAHDAGAVREACAKACDARASRLYERMAALNVPRDEWDALKKLREEAVACAAAIRSLPLPPSAGGRVEDVAEQAARQALTLRHLSDVQWETGRVGSSSEEIVQAAVAAALRGGARA